MYKYLIIWVDMRGLHGTSNNFHYSNHTDLIEVLKEYYEDDSEEFPFNINAELEEGEIKVQGNQLTWNLEETGVVLIKI